MSDRIKELLEHNNALLQENRDQRAVIRQVTEVLKDNHQRWERFIFPSHYPSSGLRTTNKAAITAGVVAYRSKIHTPEKSS